MSIGQLHACCILICPLDKHAAHCEHELHKRKTPWLMTVERERERFGGRQINVRCQMHGKTIALTNSNSFLIDYTNRRNYVCPRSLPIHMIHWSSANLRHQTNEFILLELNWTHFLLLLLRIWLHHKFPSKMQCNVCMHSIEHYSSS